MLNLKHKCSSNRWQADTGFPLTNDRRDSASFDDTHVDKALAFASVFVSRI